MDNYVNVREHFKFLGYEIEDINLTEEDRARNAQKKHFFVRIHPPRNSFFVTYHPDKGFNFISSYKIKQDVEFDKAILMELLNKMSLECYTVGFVLSRNSEEVYLLAWYPDNYHKQTFGLFLDNIENDLRYTINHNPGILKFIY